MVNERHKRNVVHCAGITVSATVTEDWSQNKQADNRHFSSAPQRLPSKTIETTRLALQTLAGTAKAFTIFVVMPKSGSPPESYAEAQVAHLASSEGPKRQRKHWSLSTCEPYASQLQANVSQSEDIVTGEVMKLLQDEISPGPLHLSNQDQLVDSSQTLFRRTSEDWYNRLSTRSEVVGDSRFWPISRVNDL